MLPRLDVAGAFGVPLLLLFLWRSRSRATYAGVFLVVAALELYGTSIGTWRWAATLPGLGIPDGNPPSGVASGPSTALKISAIYNGYWYWGRPALAELIEEEIARHARRVIRLRDGLIESDYEVENSELKIQNQEFPES